MFEESIKYTISQSELQTRTLNVSVWNRDAFGRNTFLGEVLMPLDMVSLDSYKPTWHPLCNKVSFKYIYSFLPVLNIRGATVYPKSIATPPAYSHFLYCLLSFYHSS